MSEAIEYHIERETRRLIAERRWIERGATSTSGQVKLSHRQRRILNILDRLRMRGPGNNDCAATEIRARLLLIIEHRTRLRRWAIFSLFWLGAVASLIYLGKWSFSALIACAMMFLLFLNFDLRVIEHHAQIVRLLRSVRQPTNQT